MAEQRSYYAIIPANVRYDDGLPANAKLLYGEITALCNEKGYCWATNNYFASLYNTTPNTISRWIKALKDKGYINVQMNYREGTKEIVNRYIQICGEGINKNDDTPIDKNVKDNNTSINNTFNNKKERKKPTKATGYDEIINSKIEDNEVKELLYEFIKMRSLKKKPLTDRALIMQINKLFKLSSDIEIQKKIIEKAIVKCWDEFYPYKEEYDAKSKGNNEPDLSKYER